MARGNCLVQSRTRFLRMAALSAIGALGLAAGTQRAMGQFTLTSEDRSLDANVNLGDSDDVTTAGVYNNSVSDNGEPDFTGNSINTSATATQDSDIETNGFEGQGEADTSAEVSGLIEDSTDAEANSSFSVTFTVPVVTDIQLSGELDSDGNSTESVSLDTFTENASSSNPTDPFLFNDVLQPGMSYTLSLMSGTDSGAVIDGMGPEDDTDAGTGTYSFSMTQVPEPGSLGLVMVGVSGLLARRRRA
jgi:PEP-CTERM motif